jgi:uncharacterized membrane protein
MHLDTLSVIHAQQNLTLTPPFIYVLAGFGAISILWIPGAISAWRSRAIQQEHLVLLVAWIVVQGLMIYAPFRFQRRFLEGLQFPLTVLTVPALYHLFARIQSRWRQRKETIMVGGLLAVCFVFLTSNAFAYMRTFGFYSDTSDYRFFTEKSEARASQWLRMEAPPSAVILSTPQIGNDLVGLAGKRVYAGHWSETIGIEEKDLEITRFYHDDDDEAQAAFIHEHGITHVYFGPVERSLALRSFGRSFERVFEDGGVEIYVLRRTRP